jgi:aspartate aminotransferase-like enzyme
MRQEHHEESSMSSLLPKVDPKGLLEYSVVFNDRSLNHMSQAFQAIMRDISSTLKQVYNADAIALVPGGGTFGMEAVARQFASDKACLVIRNGWFSYRWSQIFEMGRIPRAEIVLKARTEDASSQSPFAPAPIAEVVAKIRSDKPDLVFAAHVETSAGIMLSSDYIKAMADAIHEVGGMLVLDCIASGAIWVDMKALGVDVLISAPQKGWSASPAAALIMMSAKAEAQLSQTKSSSFAADLSKWRQIMKAYEDGAHAYHATMPTDAIASFHQAMKEMEAIGFDRLKEAQIELGSKVRNLLAKKSFPSVAAKGFEAASVVVSYTTDDGIHKGSKFIEQGLQTAAGVPLMCDEGADFKTFRIGLFGLDKLQNVDRTVSLLEKALHQL